MERALKVLWRECTWSNLRQIRVDAFNVYLAKLQERGRGARTLNHYRECLHVFLSFCKDQRWIEIHPLEGHKKAREHTKKRPRRAYTLDEFEALCTASKRHSMLYFVAGLSGLRRAELRKLEKRDLTPTGVNPTWHLRPEIAKSKRREVTPMLPDVLPIVQALWEALPSPTSRLFPRIPRYHTLHKDIENAKIKRFDEEGRQVDFHSLRYFFCTLLVRHLPIQTVRLLMRHRDIRQTCNLYLDLGLTDVAEAVSNLPSLLKNKMSAPIRAHLVKSCRRKSNRGDRI